MNSVLDLLIRFLFYEYHLLMDIKKQIKLGLITGFMAGILLAYINPINPYFLKHLHLWFVPFIYAFGTLVVTVVMTQIVNRFFIHFYNLYTLTLGQILVIVLLYNIVLIFGGRLLSFVLNDGAYDHEKMDYFFWSWHFYIYLISCACYVGFLIYANIKLKTDILSRYKSDLDILINEKAVELFPLPSNHEVITSSVLDKPDVLAENHLNYQQKNDDHGHDVSKKRTVIIKDKKFVVDRIYYIRAFQKYIDVCVEEGNELKVYVIRTTLLNTTEVLQPFTNFFRCHKSYIINIDKIENISGNSRQFFIHILKYDKLIPVSRSQNDFATKWLSYKVVKL